MKNKTAIAALVVSVVSLCFSAFCLGTMYGENTHKETSADKPLEVQRAWEGESSQAEDIKGEKLTAAPLNIPEDARVSYLGPAGTYTEGAAKAFFPETAQLSPQETVDDALAQLSEGKADYSVIPQENTIGGAVTNYVDALLAAEDVYVVGEVVLPISQTLMGIKGTQLSDIKTVCSHAQGIAQSQEWRKTNLPDAVTEEKDSTAAAADYVAKKGDKSVAAIAAPGAAQLYGLEVLAENVQITMENKTRFYVLSKEKPEAGHQAAVFAVKCTADRIDDVIVALHEAGLEMAAIHDRPEGSALGSYNFIVEVENHSGITEKQLSAVKDFEEVRLLGVFDRLTVK